MTPNEVGELIRKKRLEMQMTQKELAEKLNVTNKAVSQWERGICFPDICMIKSLTDVLPITLTEIFIGEEEETEEEYCVENVLQNTLGYAEQNMDYKLRRYKKIGSVIGGIIFGLPIVAVLLIMFALVLLIFFAPEAYITETLAFALLVAVFYNIRFGIPLFLAYILIVWKYSHLMEGKVTKYIKKGIFIVGVSAALLWIYESVKIF